MAKSRKYILAEGVDDSRCFCCGKDKNSHFERHHFPRPHSVGGETYVPLCGMCHDMVDRYTLENWQEPILKDISENLAEHWSVLELLIGLEQIAKDQGYTENDDDVEDITSLYSDRNELDSFEEKVLDSYLERVYNFDEISAWTVILSCENINMKLLAMKVISMVFNEQMINEWDSTPV